MKTGRDNSAESGYESETVYGRQEEVRIARLDGLAVLWGEFHEAWQVNGAPATASAGQIDPQPRTMNNAGNVITMAAHQAEQTASADELRLARIRENINRETV